MAALASRSPLALIGRRLVAAMNAWSYSIARSRAERRRQLSQQARPAAPTAVPTTPRWPTSWGD